MPCCSLRLQTLLREVQLHPLRGEHVGEVVAQARSQLNVVCIGEGCAINSRCTHFPDDAISDEVICLVQSGVFDPGNGRIWNLLSRSTV